MNWRKPRLADDEQEQLEQELYTLNNADEIKRNLSGAYYLMQESEAAALSQLREAGHQLSATEKFNPAIAELSND
jgi:DNA repair protein RecN (Recombination protein N)